MNLGKRKQLLALQLASLNSSSMTVREVGSGSYHFVSYDPTFRHATLRRFQNVSQMAASYGAWLARDEEHLEIHLSMLQEAGLLTHAEKQTEICDQSYRLTFNRRAFAA